MKKRTVKKPSVQECISGIFMVPVRLGKDRNAEKWINDEYTAHPLEGSKGIRHSGFGEEDYIRNTIFTLGSSLVILKTEMNEFKLTADRDLYGWKN